MKSAYYYGDCIDNLCLLHSTRMLSILYLAFLLGMLKILEHLLQDIEIFYENNLNPLKFPYITFLYGRRYFRNMERKNEWSKPGWPQWLSVFVCTSHLYTSHIDLIGEWRTIKLACKAHVRLNPIILRHLSSQSSLILMLISRVHQTHSSNFILSEYSHNMDRLQINYTQLVICKAQKFIWMERNFQWSEYLIIYNLWK